MIEFKNVNKFYNQGSEKIHALNTINLKITKGDIFGCIGFSGAGKSTLLRCVNGLESIDSGEVLVNGINIQQLKINQQRQLQKDIGIIFQQFNLLNQKTVYNNIKVILEISGYPKQKIANRITEVLDFVGLADKANAFPNQLSGGQKQRVGIARAIANEPRILLCDEPTSALDPITTKSILDLIQKVNVQLGITVLLITHEMEVISSICNKVAIMETGNILEQGDTYDVFVNPRLQITKQLVNSVINNELPPVIKEKIAFKDNRRIRQLIYNADEVSQPLISYLSRKFPVEISILYGSIIEFQHQLLGNLVVEFICDDPTLKLVYAELEVHKLNVREVEL